jgi:50S ribosomal subunit-associated GTPase HflX
VIHVFNKADLLADPAGFITQVRARYPHAVLAAAHPQSAIHNPQLSVDTLRSVLRAAGQALRPLARIEVPVSDGRLLAELHRDAEVVSERSRDGVVEVEARVEARTLGRLRREGIAVEIRG